MSYRGRGRGRKRFREEYVEPEPEKKANKRTVFSESGSPEYPESPESVKIQEKEMTRKILQTCMTRDSIFWRRLALRGPFCDFQVKSALHKNRPLYNLGRLICHRIHENCIEYMEKELPAIVARDTAPHLFEAERIMEGMCEKVLKIEENGKIYELYVDKMMSVVTKLFKEERIEVKLDLHPEIMKTLVAICKKKKIEASSEEMAMLRNGLLRTFYYMAADLVAFILSTKVSITHIVMIHGYRKLDALPNSQFYSVDDDVRSRKELNRLSTLSYRNLTRNLSVSLWTSIPCEESDHLLEHVLKYGLIQVLPESAKEFLTEWMTGVRTRMRKNMKRKELQMCVKRMFGDMGKEFTLKSNDARLRSFLRQISGQMLNTPDFELVAGIWQNYMAGVIEKKQKVVVEPYEKFFEVSEKIPPDAYAQLAAHFSKSPPDQAMLYHTTAQLLRFAVSFVCSTVRQVFIHDGFGELTYNGKLEEETTDFGVFREYNKDPQIHVPPPSATRTVNTDMVNGCMSRPSAKDVPASSESDSESEEPPAKRANLEEPIADEKKRIREPDEVRIVKQTVFMKPPQFWRSLGIRGPFAEIWFACDFHRNRPLFNMIRLLFHKIHANCKTFLEHDLKRIIAGGVIPNVGDLMDELCEKVLKVELGGAVYNFHVPRMMDPIEKLAYKSFITLECYKFPQLVEKLRTLCYVYDIDADQLSLEKVRNAILRQFYFMAFDLVGFVFDIVPCGHDAVQVNGFRSSHSSIGNSIYQTFIESISFRGYVNSLSLLRIGLMPRKVPYNLLAWLVCEESDHLLEHVLVYGLLEVLPESVKEFLTEWIIGVRRRLRKQMTGGKINEKVQECFPGRIPFKTGLDDKKLHNFLKIFIGKTLNSKKFTIYDDEWEENALEAIQSDRNLLTEPYSRFFEVSQLINTDAKSTLSALFSKSHADRAMLYHTIAQLYRFTMFFVCYTIRHIFHFDGQTKELKYDGKLDEEFDGFEEFEKYEMSPTIEVPLPKRPILAMTSSNTPDIHPVQLRIFPAEGAPPPATERKSFVVKSEIPASESFDYPREKKFRPSEKEQARKSSTESPEPPVPEKKFTPHPAKKSFTVEPSSTVKEEPDLSAEVTDEELNAARALRPASEAATSENRRIDEDDRIPEEWKEMYRLLCQWNTELKEHRDRIEKQHDRYYK